MMPRRYLGRLGLLIVVALICVFVACTPLWLGRRFPIDPQAELKVGHDQKSDVLRKMGRPYRSFVDSEGREVFTYLWADGEGNGQKAVIAFNKNNVIYLIEVSP
jgi:hypothetical protein